LGYFEFFPQFLTFFSTAFCQEYINQTELLCSLLIVNACTWLYSSPPGLRRTTWHVTDTVPSSSSAPMSREAYDEQHTAAQTTNQTLDTSEAQQLLTVAASRVWEELYVCKKPVCNLVHL